MSMYEFMWIGRCRFGTSDKVWGYFFYNLNRQPSYSDSVYVFWAGTGKSPNIKRSFYNSRSMQKLVSEKKRKFYTQISETNLIKIWPTFIADLDSKLVLYSLVNSE